MSQAGEAALERGEAEPSVETPSRRQRRGPLGLGLVALVLAALGMFMVYRLVIVAPTTPQAPQAGGRPPAIAASPVATPGPQERLGEAQKAVARRDFDHAIQLLEALKQSDPNTERLHDELYGAHFGYGMMLLAQDSLDMSYDQFNKALGYRAKDAAAEDGLNQVDWRRMDRNWSNDEVALAALERIWSRNPDYLQVREKLHAKLIARAKNLADHRECEGALRDANRATEVYPGSQEADQVRRRCSLTPAPVPVAPALPPADSSSTTTKPTTSPTAKPTTPPTTKPTTPPTTKPTAPTTKPTTPPTTKPTTWTTPGG